MSPHYMRPSAASETVAPRAENGDRGNDDALAVAAGALRETDIEAAGPVAEPTGCDGRLQLESLSIDELRVMASELNVPNCGQIVEQADLIAAIRERL